MGESLHVNSLHRLMSLYDRKMILTVRNKHTDIKGEILHPLTAKEHDWLIWIFLYSPHSSKLSTVLEISVCSESA